MEWQEGIFKGNEKAENRGLDSIRHPLLLLVIEHGSELNVGHTTLTRHTGDSLWVLCHFEVSAPLQGVKRRV